MEARTQSPASIRKLKTLKRQLETFAKNQGIKLLDEFTPDHASAFRASWAHGSISGLKKLERMRSTFRFFVRKEWIEKNPAQELDAPTITELPTLPFTGKEVDAILQHATGRWHALYLLLNDPTLQPRRAHSTGTTAKKTQT